MSLLKCPECGNDVSSSATTCPNCGCPIKKVNHKNQFEETYGKSDFVVSANTSSNSAPFYSRTWFILLMMFCCCFPVGLYLMWKYKKFPKAVRIIITGYFAILMVGAIGKSRLSGSGNVASEALSVAASEVSSETTESTLPETIPEESTAVETTTIGETTSVESEEDFKASCQEINYKTLFRNSDDYIGQRIVITAKIQQIMQGGFFDNGQYYRVMTDNDGYEIYFDDEYFMYDCRPDGSMKLLEGDVLKIYAEFIGTENIVRALTGATEEIPAIKAFYIDLIEE